MPNEQLESQAEPEVQQKAEKLGWIPPTRYKGDPERYIDAEEFLERGETVMPILKENNRKMKLELDTLRETSRAQSEALQRAEDAIDQIEERHSVETQKAVERARADVKRQLAAASAEGDHEGVAELTDQLTRLKAAEEAAGEREEKPEQQAPFMPPAELRQWNEDNPWFGPDKRKTALALGIAQELREGGEQSTGRAFFDKVTAEMNGMFGEREERQTSSKVEGARNGSDGDARVVGKKSYAALPKDAKEACDADARSFVGPTKKYKNLADWRGRYAELYFEGN